MESHRCAIQIKVFFSFRTSCLAFKFFFTLFDTSLMKEKLIYQCDHAQALLVNAGGNNSGIGNGKFLVLEENVEKHTLMCFIYTNRRRDSPHLVRELVSSFTPADNHLPVML